MDHYDTCLPPRQLTALTTFSALVAEAQQKAEADAIAAGMANDHLPLRNGGQGAKAYGEAVGVYLAFAVDRLADIGSSIALLDKFNRCNQKYIWAPSNTYDLGLC